MTGTTANVTPTALFPAGDITGGVGDGAAVTFNFSDIANSDIAAAGDDFIVIQFNALVDNSTANQTTGTTDTNTFITDLVNDGSGPTQVGPASNPVSVVIAQPAIANTSKTVTSTGRDPGDTVSYKVTYSNSGDADAFDARLIDTLPSGLTLNTGSITVLLNGSPAAYTSNTAGNTVDVTLAQVMGTENGTPGSVEIDYTATINTADPAGMAISNTANLTYNSLPGRSARPSIRPARAHPVLRRGQRRAQRRRRNQQLLRHQQPDHHPQQQHAHRLRLSGPQQRRRRRR